MQCKYTAVAVVLTKNMTQVMLCISCFDATRHELSCVVRFMVSLIIDIIELINKKLEFRLEIIIIIIIMITIVSSFFMNMSFYRFLLLTVFEGVLCWRNFSCAV